MTLAPQMYKVGQVATVLNVSSRTVHRLVARGELRAVRIGRTVRIKVGEVERYLSRK